jgi:hypothetical protein
MVHGGWVLPEMMRIGFDNQILSHLRCLSHTRQPSMNFPG